MATAKPMVHGRGYDRGCRCEECVAGRREIQRRYEARKKAGIRIRDGGSRSQRSLLATEYGLTPFEELVLIRLGHLQPRSFTLAEIGSIMNLTTQRVSQIYRGSLDKLRRSKLNEWREDAA